MDGFYTGNALMKWNKWMKFGVPPFASEKTKKTTPRVVFQQNFRRRTKGGGHSVEGLGSGGASTRALPEAWRSKCPSCDAQIAEGTQLSCRRSLGNLDQFEIGQTKFGEGWSDLYMIIKGSLVANFRYTNFWVAWQE